MLGYTGVNHNPIEFIRQIPVSSNIGKKIYVDYLTSNISGVDIIE